MIRATRGRSRRPNHMRSQIGGPKAMPPVALRRLPGDFHSVAKQASFRIAFRSDFGGFGRPKWMPKSMFEALFFDVFFECVCTPMLGRFFEAPNLENRALASTGTRFSQNRRFQKRFEKTSILALFLEAKPKKIQ